MTGNSIKTYPNLPKVILLTVDHDQITKSYGKSLNVYMLAHNGSKSVRYVNNTVRFQLLPFFNKNHAIESYIRFGDTYHFIFRFGRDR